MTKIIIKTPPPAVKDRPKCPGCNKPLRPAMDQSYSGSDAHLERAIKSGE